MFGTLVYPKHPDEIYSNRWPECRYGTNDIPFLFVVARHKCMCAHHRYKKSETQRTSVVDQMATAKV